MGRTFLDLESGKLGFGFGENLLMDSDGDLMMKMGDNIAMDMESGDLHIVSSFGDSCEDKT